MFTVIPKLADQYLIRQTTLFVYDSITQYIHKAWVYLLLNTCVPTVYLLYNFFVCIVRSSIYLLNYLLNNNNRTICLRQYSDQLQLAVSIYRGDVCLLRCWHCSLNSKIWVKLNMFKHIYNLHNYAWLFNKLIFLGFPVANSCLHSKQQNYISIGFQVY